MIRNIWVTGLKVCFLCVVSWALVASSGGARYLPPIEKPFVEEPPTESLRQCVSQYAGPKGANQMFACGSYYVAGSVDANLPVLPGLPQRPTGAYIFLGLAWADMDQYDISQSDRVTNLRISQGVASASGSHRTMPIYVAMPIEVQQPDGMTTTSYINVPSGFYFVGLSTASDTFNFSYTVQVPQVNEGSLNSIQSDFKLSIDPSAEDLQAITAETIEVGSSHRLVAVLMGQNAQDAPLSLEQFNAKVRLFGTAFQVPPNEDGEIKVRWTRGPDGRFFIGAIATDIDQLKLKIEGSEDVEIQ